ncbi:MAG: 50S ribosomal protein L37ae [Candidatus Nezhaarchaeota archaeon]|nr:50S ribosomal protein L37ae [Candidatus Nezhaarchaeota archaeon]
MARTKVTKSTARFGARYGYAVRKRVGEVEQKLKSKHRCPSCLTLGSLKRRAVGIWFCRKCGKVFAGGAYTPFSMRG